MLAMFTLSQEYKAFCQDIVWRLTTAPNFKPDNESIERACQHAFKVASIFYPRWEVENERLSQLADANHAANQLASNDQTPPKAKKAKKRGDQPF